MAEYQPIISATVEAYQLGAASPPAWYAPLVASKDIIVAPQDANRYTVLTTADGPKPARNGDYVIYAASIYSEDEDPVLVSPASLRVMDKATFEATYELVPEEP